MLTGILSAQQSHFLDLISAANCKYECVTWYLYVCTAKKRLFKLKKKALIGYDML